MTALGTSLRIRLLIYFLLLVSCVLGFVGVVSFISGRDSIKVSVKSHLESVAVLKEQEINTLIEHLRHTLLWLTTDVHLTSEINQLINGHDSEPTKIGIKNHIVEEFQRLIAIGHFSEIYVLGKESGEVLVASNRNWEGKFRNFESYFHQGKRDVFVTEFFLSLTMERPTMVISGPVLYENELVAVLAAHINVNALTEIMLERSGLGETGETYLVNQSNLMITDTLFSPNAAFNKWIFTAGVEQALKGKKGVGEYLDYRNQEVIGAYRWLENSKLALIAEQDISEAFAPVTNLRNTTLAIALFVGILALILSQVISRSIIKPINQIIYAAKKIGEGKLHHRINSSARDEIGLLANHFDLMSENLDKITVSRIALAEKVQERTEELTKVHQELLKSEKMAVMGQLAGSVGHELRNPLGVISNAVYYLKLILPQANDRTIQYLEIIESEVFRSSKIVSDLLHLFRSKPANTKRTKVSELLDISLDKIPIPQGIVVSKDIPSYLPSIYVDPYQTIQIFSNLITNAVQAMPEGGNLQIEGRIGTEKILVSFFDSGSGIAQEDEDKIFKPLFTTKARGIGLGLAVSKKFAEANRGKIRFINLENGGSAFIVELPINENSADVINKVDFIGSATSEKQAIKPD